MSSEVFNEELNLIKNQEIRVFTRLVLDRIPAPVWDRPSSSSGKYHPPSSQGHRGLYRHTQAVVVIAVKLTEVYGLTTDDTDIVIAAAILHDGLKYSLIPGKHTTKTHPEDMAKFVSLIAKKTNFNSEFTSKLVSGISRHMGRWSQDKPQFPGQFTSIEQIVHLADVIAANQRVSISGLDEDPNLIG